MSTRKTAYKGIHTGAEMTIKTTMTITTSVLPNTGRVGVASITTTREWRVRVRWTHLHTSTATSKVALSMRSMVRSAFSAAIISTCAAGNPPVTLSSSDRRMR